MSRLLKLFASDILNIFRLFAYLVIFFIYRISGIKTIVFNLHHDYFFDIFKPVYNELKKNKQIKIFFSYSYENKKLKTYLLQNCSHKLLISNYISPFIPFDLFICPEITGPDFPISFLKTKTIQIYHGTGVYNLFEKSDVLNRFDIHFAIGPQYLDFIEEAYKNADKKPVIYKIGYPKLDSLLQLNQLQKS